MKSDQVNKMLQDNPLGSIPISDKPLPDSLEVCNNLRLFRLSEIREKMDRWAKKPEHHEFLKKLALFFTK